MQENECLNINQLISTIPLGIVIINNQLKVSSANPNFTQMFAINTSEINHLHFCETVRCKGCNHNSDCELLNNIKAIFNNNHNTFFLEKTIKSGNCETPKTLKFYISRFNDEALLTIEDITQNKVMENQLIQSERLAATGRLSASVAHEINNPLQGIISHLDLMKDGLPKNSKKLKNYDQVKSNVKKISTIVKQLLDIHRNSENEKTKIDVNHLITRVINLLSNQLQIKNIKIKQQLETNLPRISGFQQQLHQIFLNLLLNALENLNQGGEIIVSTSTDKKNVIIKIKDNGQGIAKENLKQIFNPFFSTKKDTGVGLGLFVCQKLVTNHGGKIDVTSHPNQGSTFTITLPMPG